MDPAPLVAGGGARQVFGRALKAGAGAMAARFPDAGAAARRFLDRNAIQQGVWAAGPAGVLV
jgi:hypothetical protein